MLWSERVSIWEKHTLALLRAQNLPKTNLKLAVEYFGSLRQGFFLVLSMRELFGAYVEMVRIFVFLANISQAMSWREAKSFAPLLDEANVYALKLDVQIKTQGG